MASTQDLVFKAITSASSPKEAAELLLRNKKSRKDLMSYCETITSEKGGDKDWAVVVQVAAAFLGSFSPPQGPPQGFGQKPQGPPQGFGQSDPIDLEGEVESQIAPIDLGNGLRLAGTASNYRLEQYIPASNRWSLVVSRAQAVVLEGKARLLAKVAALPVGQKFDVGGKGFVIASFRKEPSVYLRDKDGKKAGKYPYASPSYIAGKMAHVSLLNDAIALNS